MTEKQTYESPVETAVKAQLDELQFEQYIATYLGNHGWIYTPGVNDQGWDTELALYRDDVLDWLRTNYPDQYKIAVPEGEGEVVTSLAENRLLKRIVEAINTPSTINAKNGKIEGGLLGLLRTGFNHTVMGQGTAKFGPMVAFAPQNPANIGEIERSKTNKFRVIQQVHFDTKGKDTIDLVLLVNGIPVVTLELKSSYKQTVHDAVKQYQVNRIPSANRPLLQPGRALVHFAVSNQEVYMCTELIKPDKKAPKEFRYSRFLPFNRGTSDGHAGNDPNPNGSASSYLWEEIFEPSLFLRILRDYVLWEPDSKNKNKGKIVFPRYHQLRANERVVNDIAANGVGNTYLIQHSAGSGKTKTMAWLAQRLSKYFNPRGKKQFDSVILVSDRNVLDQNIADSLRLLQVPSNKIVWAQQGAEESKSRQLKSALDEGNKIIVCTIQSFLALMKAASTLEEEAQNSENLLVVPRNRKYAVIIDEAHSSQHGETSSAMKQTLASLGIDEEEKDGLSTDELLVRINKAIANSENLSFVALTATPHEETLAEFGIPDPDEPGEYMPFDTYSMAQAIEEGFILDVLKQYSTYDMFAEVRDNLGRTDSVVQGEAVTEMTKFVRLHDTSIAQKVEIVVEHFRRNVKHHLDGQARAMVVTENRRAAYNWSKKMNEYLARKGYDDMKTLVAFSGSMTENEDGSGDTVTEASLNGSSRTEELFKDSDGDYRVLIVANKFQTGFDEPRLVAMYVDKSLSGITAVQTLSRLNRIYPKKPDPMVIDFVNDTEDILSAFQKFYRDARIDTEVNPNALHDIGQRMDGVGLYTMEDLDALAEAYAENKGLNALDSKVQGIDAEWQKRRMNAILSENEQELEVLDGFKKDTRRYKKSWDFLHQIVDFNDAEVHKRAILAALLANYLRVDETREPEDYTSGLTLEGIEHRPRDVYEDLELNKVEEVEAGSLPDLNGHVHGEGSPLMNEFDRVVEALNERLSAEGVDIPKSTTYDLLRKTWGSMANNEKTKKLITENEPEQLLNSRGFAKQVRLAMGEASDEIREGADAYEEVSYDQAIFKEFIRYFARMAGTSKFGRELDESLH